MGKNFLICSGLLSGPGFMSGITPHPGELEKSHFPSGNCYADGSKHTTFFPSQVKTIIYEFKKSYDGVALTFLNHRVLRDQRYAPGNPGPNCKAKGV